ncbi:hypothetical protein FRC09_020607, partial [Ceratobasidium sp. 395]
SGGGDVLDAAAVRDDVVQDGDDAETGVEEGGAAAIERGRCARLGATIGGTVEHVGGGGTKMSRVGRRHARTKAH